MSYVGKVKGRGYFIGITRKTEYSSKTEEEIRKEKSRTGRNWVYPYNSTQYTIPIFKRNISDVPKPWICESKSEYKKSFAEHVKLNNYSADYKDDSFIEKLEILKYDGKKLEKRVRNGKLWAGTMTHALNLSIYGGTQFCNECGTNIYNDEARLNVNGSTICIHCLQAFTKILKEEYKKTPKKYKDDYLISRTLDAI